VQVCSFVHPASSLCPTHPRPSGPTCRRLAVVSAMFAWYPSPSSQPPRPRLPRGSLDLLTVLLTSSPFSQLLRCRLDLLTSSHWSRDPCHRLDLLTLVSMPSLWSWHPRRRLCALTLLSVSSSTLLSDHRGGHAPPSQQIPGRCRQGGVGGFDLALCG